MKQVINGKVYDDDVDEVIAQVNLGKSYFFPKLDEFAKECGTYFCQIYKTKDGEYYVDMGFNAQEHCAFKVLTKSQAFNWIQGLEVLIDDSQSERHEIICKKEFPEYYIEKTKDLRSLGLKKITLTHLSNNHITSVNQLLNFTYSQLKNLPGIGPKCLIDIHLRLRIHELKLAEDDFVQTITKIPYYEGRADRIEDWIQRQLNK